MEPGQVADGERGGTYIDENGIVTHEARLNGTLDLANEEVPRNGSPKAMAPELLEESKEAELDDFARQELQAKLKTAIAEKV